jgi:methionyl-tRNA synthetase
VGHASAVSLAAVKPFYVTTPIYYVNDVPHLGTAYTTVIADALARFQRMIGNPARLLTGTDEHGLKIERVAREKGLPPQELVDQVSQSFRDAWPKLGVSFDDFVRTTEPRHKAFVAELWQRIEAKGFLYEGEYEDWYCVGCESFKTEKELLPEQLCPIHKKPVERVKEKTFFFRLSQFQDTLLAFYDKHPDFIQPESRRNEVISFVKSGLLDLSVSRTSFSWGIPVPMRPEHVMYVWFDALSNYLSALAHASDASRSSTERDLRDEFWAPKARVVHIVGKDILRFHTVFWPAFLLAAGYAEEQIPATVYAHGFLTIDGQKMSKSLRNAVDPLRVAARIGAEPLRYYLLRAISFGQDGDFDRKSLLERYNADLGKNLGNLLARTLGLCTKGFGEAVPQISERTLLETDLLDAVRAQAKSVRQAWEELEPHRALECTFAISALANQYVDRAAPWTFAKTLAAGPAPEATARLGTILRTLLDVLRLLSVLIWPAMPEKSKEMRRQLGLVPVAPQTGTDWLAESEAMPVQFADKLVAGAPLFPTFDTDMINTILAELGGDTAALSESSSESTASTVPRPPTSKDQGDPKSTMLAKSTVPVASNAVPASAIPTSVGPVSNVPVSVVPGSAVPATESSPTAPITYDQFSVVDLRVGLVVAAEKVPKKDKLLKLQVDVGESAPRTIIAGLALTFAPGALVGKRVVVVANLSPRDFGKGLVSHGMLLASGPSESLHLATIDDDVAPGAKLK